MEALGNESCGRARAWMSVELDEELSELEQRWLRAHLRHCGECRGFERRTRALTAMLRAQPPARLEQPVGLPPRRSLGLPLAGLRRISTATAAAATVALVIAAAAVFHSVGAGGPGEPRFTVRLDDASSFNDVRALRKQDITARLADSRSRPTYTRPPWLENY